MGVVFHSWCLGIIQGQVGWQQCVKWYDTRSALCNKIHLVQETWNCYFGSVLYSVKVGFLGKIHLLGKSTGSVSDWHAGQVITLKIVPLENLQGFLACPLFKTINSKEYSKTGPGEKVLHRIWKCSLGTHLSIHNLIVLSQNPFETV